MLKKKVLEGDKYIMQCMQVTQDLVHGWNVSELICTLNGVNNNNTRQFHFRPQIWTDSHIPREWTDRFWTNFGKILGQLWNVTKLVDSLPHQLVYTSSGTFQNWSKILSKYKESDIKVDKKKREIRMPCKSQKKNNATKPMCKFDMVLILL